MPAATPPPARFVRKFLSAFVGICINLTQKTSSSSSSRREAKRLQAKAGQKVSPKKKRGKSESAFRFDVFLFILHFPHLLLLLLLLFSLRIFFRFFNSLGFPFSFLFFLLAGASCHRILWPIRELCVLCA